jgi:hypothetical protein
VRPRSLVVPLVALFPGLLIPSGCGEVTVTAVEVVLVEVRPSQGEVPVGETLRLSAVPRDGSGNPLPDRPVDWSTQDPSIANVSPEGVVLARTPGVVSIRASVAGVHGTAEVRVLTPARILVAEHVRFTGRVGDPDPPAKVLPISNGGESPFSELLLEVLYPDDGPTGWLTADVQQSSSGTAAVLLAEGAGLASGTHQARLRISSAHADNSPVSVDVEFHLAEAAPSIQVSAAALGFSSEAGLPPPPAETVEIWNGGGGELTGLEVSVIYEAGQPSGWLEAILRDRSAPTQLRIQPRPGTLSNGSYDARAVIASEEAANSPKEVLVRLTIGNPEEDPGEDAGEGEAGEEDGEEEEKDAGDETDEGEDSGEEDPGHGDEEEPQDDPEADDLLVAFVPEITYWTSGGPDSNRHLRISMEVVDEFGDPVPNASVSIRLTNTDTGQQWTPSSTTDTGGTVTFGLNNHPPGCYETEIRSLSAPGYTWDGATPANEFCSSS